MPFKQWIMVSLVCVVAVGVVGCRQTPAPAGGVGTNANQPVAPATAGTGAGAITGATEAPTSEQPPLVVASGTAKLPPQTPVVEVPRPQPAQGIQRAVSLKDAAAGVPFGLREPKVVPDSTGLTMVQLIAPPEGKTVAGLPAVRMIYDVNGQGLLVVYQSPATGQTAKGDAVKVGSASGWIESTDKVTIVTWEQDGVRFELRGSGIDRDTLLKAAASMTPVSKSGS